MSTITSSRYSTGKKIFEKILHVAVEAILEKWPEIEQMPGDIITGTIDNSQGRWVGLVYLKNSLGNNQ